MSALQVLVTLQQHFVNVQPGVVPRKGKGEKGELGTPPKDSISILWAF